MQITRIDSKRDMAQKVEKVQISMNGRSFTLSESNGHLMIHAHRDRIVVQPACANELLITSFDF